MNYRMLLTTLALLAGSAWAHDHDHDHGNIASLGEPGKAADAKRTVHVSMSDAMRFNPSTIPVEQGETVRFVVNNLGKLKHEMVLGTDEGLKEHAELMKKYPDMEHFEPNMVTVLPGKSGEIIWRFTKAANVSFACLQPGHFDAGMKGQVVVNATQELSEGEVRKIDVPNKKILLNHGEIKNLDMPAMNMMFRVQDPALLQGLKVGAKVRFRVERLSTGLTVTRIEPADAAASGGSGGAGK